MQNDYDVCTWNLLIGLVIDDMWNRLSNNQYRALCIKIGSGVQNCIEKKRSLCDMFSQFRQ